MSASVAMQSKTPTIDRIYENFLSKLSPAVASAGRDLPRRLGLCASKDVPWSMVFNNPAVLGLPLMLMADTDRMATLGTIDSATTAHLLAVVGAFGVDRIDDGQIEPDAELLDLIDQIHDARDAALQSMRRDNEHPMTYAWGQQQTDDSVEHEREVFEGEQAPTWSRYEAISLEKQGLAFPAAVVAARAAGWSAEDEQRVYDIIAGAALGLQYRDDVVDWIEDHERGAAWAVALMAEEHGVTAEGAEDLERALDARGTLVRMLEMSRDQFQRAADAAAGLNATRLAQWATGQAELTGRLAQQEAEEPGAAVRWEIERRGRKAARQVVAVGSTPVAA